MSIQLLAIGNENAAGFTLLFDPTLAKYLSASLGAAASSATWNVNTNQLDSGRVGFALALSSGAHFASGVDELLKVTFYAASSASGSVAVGFGDQVILREISDPTATALATD